VSAVEVNISLTSSICRQVITREKKDENAPADQKQKAVNPGQQMKAARGLRHDAHQL
jgi:hypothetical protein